MKSITQPSLLLTILLALGCGRSTSTSPQGPTNEPSISWQLVEIGEATVEMPRPISVQKQTAQSGRGPVTVEVAKSTLAGVFYNLSATQVPAEAADALNDPGKTFARLAEGQERLKEGAARTSFDIPTSSKVPTSTHEFRYPAGVNGDGAKFEAGFQKRQDHILGTIIYSAFVDVNQKAYADNKDVIDKHIYRFFHSLKIEPPSND